MIFSGKFFTGSVPFKDIYIHATVLTKDGKRMSKSLGTGINPLTVIENMAQTPSDSAWPIKQPNSRI